MLRGPCHLRQGPRLFWSCGAASCRRFTLPVSRRHPPPCSHPNPLRGDFCNPVPRGRVATLRVLRSHASMDYGLNYSCGFGLPTECTPWGPVPTPRLW